MKNSFLFIFLLFSCILSFAQVDLNLGLRAYYPFNGNANDMSGNNNNPIFNNATLTADRYGNPNSAYHFNGTDSYMQVLNSPTLNMGTQMSIALKVRPDDWYTGPCYNNMMLIKEDGDYQPGHYFLRFSDVYTGCTSPTTTTERFYAEGTVAANPIIQLNQWYDVVWTYDGTTARLYVDCVLQATNVVNITSFTNNFDLFIGHMNNAQYPYWLNGDLDDIRIYDRAINFDEVKAISGCGSITNCNNWLQTQTAGQSVKVGDLDVSGTQITVEANINRTAPYSGSYIYAGDIVSKHTNPSDANYLLRPNDAEITTSNGYFVTPPICDIELNKTYHIALVYDGTTLKFYRNGFLMSQVAASGTLFQNNVITTIADWANYTVGVGTNFIGKTNEIRIWNVARTQAQIQAYMNTSLPNPTTQAGLQAYYTFNDLINKQGNAAWNGTLLNGASINNTNPNCSFVADSCNVIPTGPCNSWLNTPSANSYASVGDLDIPGNTVTVEAKINRTDPYLPGGGNNTEGDVVSKHVDPTDVNYLLRPNHAYITTTNGFFATPDICDLSLNKTYHIAMVYDGSTLKFYRDGYLMSQVNATGNLIQNNWNTQIGHYDALVWNTQFLGYINEVRIWNVARTQAQIQAFMNTSLPSPTTQAGLQAYYIFDDLTNKQGNAAWNGALFNGATINNTNPNCSLIPDSCYSLTPNISNIINDYTPVLALNPCNNSITVEDGTAFNVGDTVLMIQMKGAIVDTTNTAAFGDIINYKNAGNYEFNYVKARTGNIIELKNRLTRQYDIPTGKVQLVRVPYYTSVNVSATLTCLPWDGNKGGVLVLNVRDTVTLNADIDVSAKGFPGAIGQNNIHPPIYNCFESNFYYQGTSYDSASTKGEGVSTVSINKILGKGKIANAGGGGNSHNSGGGGGANGGNGGLGGYQFENCVPAPYDNRGIGGISLPYSPVTNKIFLGGGGGAGHANNFDGFTSNGGNGGAIAFIMAGTLINNGNDINNKGQDGLSCSMAGTGCHEGMGGGGAGGTTLLKVGNFTSSTNISSIGGKGADMVQAANLRVGPGGGGGGGIVWFASASQPANVLTYTTGSTNGTCTSYANDPWGATWGGPGMNLLDLNIQIDTTLFKPNIDSVRIQDNATSCTGFDFNGLGYTNTSAIVGWDWDFGDGNYAHTQNTSHNYSGTGPYIVHLVATDINGCKDSVTTNVSFNPISLNAGNDTSFCSNGMVTHVLHGNTTGMGYTWTPAGLLDNNTLQNPTASVSTTTMFYLTTSSLAGCTAIDSVLITVNPLPSVSTINDFSICKLDSMLLTTSGNATGFQWTPPLSVNNPTISSPYFTDTISQQLIVTGTIAATGCFKKDTVNVTIKPLPAIQSIPDTALCGAHNVTLNSTGGQTYSWLPATGLSNPAISNPVFTGSSTQTYTVTGTGANACTAKDTVTITVNAQPVVSTISDISICRGDSIQLITNTNATNNQWIPALSVSNANIPNPYFHDTVSQQMIVTGTNVTGCFAKDTVNITVKPLPVVQTIPDSSLCGAHNITLTTTGAQTYSWLPTTDLSNPGIASPVFTGSSTQTYTVTGTGANACKANDTVSITINAVPVVSTINNAAICKGDSILLTSNSNAQVNQWSPASSVNNSTIANPYFIDTISQTMTLTGTNTGTGCFASTTVNITVKPTPDVRSISDFTSCATNTVTLITTGAQSYSWSPAANLDDPNNANPVFTGPTGTYTYYVTGTAANGCIAKDTVNITISSKPVFIAPENKTICVNQSVQLDGNNGTTYEYLWSPATHLSNPGIVDPMADPVVTTTYTLLISDHTCNYDSIFSVRVTVNPLPVVNATKSNDLDCPTPESQLTASGAVQYNWFPAAGLSNSTIYNPIASPYVTTQYIVIGTDNNGCNNSDTVTVYRKGGKYFGFNIPNSFTPNGDGLNDCFGVTYWGETKNFHLVVYNRWGEKVFETHNVSECWDGIYKGNPSEIGNYVFYLTGDTLCGKVNRKGNVLLIR